MHSSIRRAFDGPGMPAVIQSRQRVGVELDRLIVILQGEIRLILYGVGETAIVEGRRKIGPYSDGRIEIRHGMVEIAARAVIGPAADQSADIVGIEAHRLIVIGNRALGLAEMLKDTTARAIGA